MQKDKQLSVVPCHVGVIMDGNGRWATARNHKRSYGHKKGAQNIERVVLALLKEGVSYISLYAFSTENMQRPTQEVNALFQILNDGIKKYGEIALKKGVRLCISGDTQVLNEQIRQTINTYEQKTACFNKPVLNICINYGARQELCFAFNNMLKDNLAITWQNIQKSTYNGFLPPVDLVIRTGGEHRLSNFMLFQCAYAELYFTDVLWPDFSKEEVKKALSWFADRKRRFGKL